MNTTKTEKLSEEEMSQIKGGGRWVLVEGTWHWIETFDLGEEEHE
ncbi:bacteriocin [Bacteroides sp.]|nr:bacteriocin [Bacteroides sp.]